MPYRTVHDRFDALRSSLDRLFDEVVRRTGPASEDEVQPVPVNVFESDTDVVVVAAMPGLEVDNIDVRAEEGTLVLFGEKRGPGQENHRYLQREWTYGPYERRVRLPGGVDLEAATATYGNGVVTVAIPKTADRRARRIQISIGDERRASSVTPDAAASGTRG